MRSRADRRIDGKSKTKLPKRPVGGKALQRLLLYVAKRDPSLIAGVLALAPFPSAVPQWALTAKTKAWIERIRKGRWRKPSSARYAAKIVDAALTLAAVQPTATVAWQSIGPSLIPNGQTYGTNKIPVIGRVSAIAVDPADAMHLLCGGADGGIWESLDEGTTWAPRTDGMPSLAIGAIVFDPQNSQVVYAGSGEGNWYWFVGAGLYKSVDGGTTWTVLAAATFLGIGFFRLYIDPIDTNVIHAATTNGFYVSTDAGSTWSQKRAGPCWDVCGGYATFKDGLFLYGGGSSLTPVTLPGAPTGNWTRLAVDLGPPTADFGFRNPYVFGASASGAACSPSALMRQSEGLHERRISGSS